MKTVSYKTWGIISGVIWLLVTLAGIITVVVSYRNIGSNSSYHPSFFSIFWMNIIGWVLSVLFAIALLTDILPMAKVARIITSVWGLVSLVSALMMILNHTSYLNTTLNLFSNLLGFVSGVLIIVALFSLGKNGQLFCLIALGCTVLSSIMSSMSYGVRFGTALTGNLLFILFSAAEYITLSFYVAGKPKQLAAASVIRCRRQPQQHRKTGRAQIVARQRHPHQRGIRREESRVVGPIIFLILPRDL